jgi:hypothetical protein
MWKLNVMVPMTFTGRPASFRQILRLNPEDRAPLIGARAAPMLSARSWYSFASDGLLAATSEHAQLYSGSTMLG